jgi:MIP family channel proteins
MFILAVIIYAFADTSGGLFNPAVTVALASVRRISPANALTYVVVQLAGGVAGALLGKVVFLDPGRAAHYGAATINRAAMHGTPLRALIAEALGTFILVLAIMATAVNPRGPKAAAGLIIGASLALGVMVFGPLTGAGFNPARWFGPALVIGKYSDAWVYIVGPLVGGVLAAQLYDALVLKREPVAAV